MGGGGSLFKSYMRVNTPSLSRIGRFFGAKTRQYETAAVVQKKALDLLAGLVRQAGGPWYPCVDLGCGIGVWNVLARRRGRNGLTVGLDCAYEALGTAAWRRGGSYAVQGDIEHPPFAVGSCRMAVLASVLHWSSRPKRVLEQTARILGPHGWLAFSFFLKGSFRELLEVREEWGLESPARYAAESQYRSWLARSGFAVRDAHIMEAPVFFPSAGAALAAFSAMGAAATAGKRLSRSEISRFCETYEQKFKTARGVPVSCSVMLGLARLG